MGNKSKDSDEDLSDLEEQIRLKVHKMAMTEAAFKQERELKMFEHANQQMIQEKLFEETRKARTLAETAKKSAEETANKLSNIQVKINALKTEQNCQAPAKPKFGLLRTLWSWIW